MNILKQSTAAILKLGPFVDSTDGVTAETGLTIAQADIQISKAGGAFAQTSDSSPTTTHDADGWYPVPLTTTDTATLGALVVQVAMSGALPVFWRGMVVPANVYDALVGGSDYLQVDAVQVEGGDASDGIRDAVVDDATRIDASALNTAATAVGSNGSGLTEAGGTGDHLTAVPWNAAWDAEVQSECTDALNAYDPPTRAELTSDIGTVTSAVSTAQADLDTLTGSDGVTLATSQPNYTPATSAALATVDGIVDAILVDTGTTIPAQISGLTIPSAAAIRAEIDSNSTQLAAIVADTNELQTDDLPTLIATVDTVVDAIKAKTDALTISAVGVEVDVQGFLGDQWEGDGTEGNEYGPA